MVLKILAFLKEKYGKKYRIDYSMKSKLHMERKTFDQ